MSWCKRQSEQSLTAGARPLHRAVSSLPVFFNQSLISLNTPSTDSQAAIQTRYPWNRWISLLEQREDQVFLFLALLIGALVGLTVVAFIVLTERLGMKLYPPGVEAWRRLLVPAAGLAA